MIIFLILLIFWLLLWVFVIVLNLFSNNKYLCWVVNLNKLVIFFVFVFNKDEINLLSFVNIIGSFSIFVMYRVSWVFFVLGILKSK